MACPDAKSEAEIRVRKLHLQALVLKQQGNMDLAVELVRKALKTAQEFELYDFQITAHDFLALNGNEGLIDPGKQWNSSMSAIGKLKHIHFSKAFARTKLVDKPRFESRREEPGRLEFWKSTKELQVFKTKREYEKAYSCGLKAMQVAKDRSKIFSKEEIFSITLEMGKVCIYQNQLSNAESFADKALSECFSKKSERDAKELMFYVHFSKRSWNEAEKLIKQELGACKESNQIKWRYFKANIAFVQQHYRESIKLLNTRIVKSESQHEILSTGGKVLEMMNLVEMKDYDWLSFRIDSFRKHLKTINKDQRCKVIHQLFKALAKDNFDFDSARRKEQSSLNLLKEGKDIYFRDPLGFELIDVYKWFMNRALFTSSSNAEPFQIS